MEKLNSIPYACLPRTNSSFRSNAQALITGNTLVKHTYSLETTAKNPVRENGYAGLTPRIARRESVQ